MAFASLPSILSDKCGLEGGDRLLVGVSGGPDSLALLHALQALGWQPTAAHFDHGLRPGSEAEAKQVEQWAAAWGLPFHAGRGNVAALAKSQSLSLEEAARELRYRFLFDTAAREGADAVLVGHNADDQAETVLMHLLRGAGLDGLSGMAMRSLPNPWSADIPLLRPLLDIWREEIESYCHQHELVPIQDESNRDLSFFRNRLRHELLPTLAEFNPRAKAHLHQSARLLEADRQLIEQLTAKAWPRLALVASRDFVQFDRLALLAEPLSLQRQLVRRAFGILRPGARDLGLAAVELALEQAAQAHSGRVVWLDSLYLRSEGPHLWLADWEASLPAPWPQAPEQPLILELPEEVSLGQGWRLLAQMEAPDYEAAGANQDVYQAWLDAERLDGQLVLRRRQPGDRFQPLGMPEGSLKLADYMINVKLPQRARATWPLLCHGEEVVWLPGHQIAEAYRLRPESGRALHLHLRQTGN